MIRETNVLSKIIEEEWDKVGINDILLNLEEMKNLVDDGRLEASLEVRSSHFTIAILNLFKASMEAISLNSKEDKYELRNWLVSGELKALSIAQPKIFAILCSLQEKLFS